MAETQTWKSGQATQDTQAPRFYGTASISQAIECGGYGKTWGFWYFGKKDQAPRYRWATVHPPTGDKPTLVSGSHFVGYDPHAKDRKTGAIGGFRFFYFGKMDDLSPVEGYFTP